MYSHNLHTFSLWVHTMAYILQALLLLFVASAMSGSHRDSGENARGGASRRGRRTQTSFFASTPVTSNPEQDVINTNRRTESSRFIDARGRARASTTRLTRERVRAERVSRQWISCVFRPRVVQRRQQRLQLAKGKNNAQRRARRDARRCESSTSRVYETDWRLPVAGC